MSPHFTLPSRIWLAVVLAGSLAACTSNAPSVDPQPVAGIEVAVVDNAFEPSVLQVDVGQTVTWTWQGDSPHDVAFADSRSEIQRSGTYTKGFENAGEFAYRCTVHPRMTGTIVVVAP